MIHECIQCQNGFHDRELYYIIVAKYVELAHRGFAINGASPSSFPCSPRAKEHKPVLNLGTTHTTCSYLLFLAIVSHNNRSKVFSTTLSMKVVVVEDGAISL